MDQLVQWRKERLGDANFFYRNYVFSELVKRYFKNQSDADAKKRIQAWMGQISAAYAYNRICLHDITGTERISFPEVKIHAPFAFSVHSAEALRSGKVEFQDLYRDENDKKVYLTIFVPILAAYDDKKPLGVIALRIDPTQYLYPLIENWPTPSKTSETLIIRRDGNDALFLNNLRFQKDAALHLRVPITNESMPAVKAALGYTGIVEGIDYRGVPVIADVRAVPDSPWFLVARIDMEEVYAPLRERMWLMVFLISALIMGTGAIAGFVWRDQRSRFYKEQLKLAEALRVSDIKYRQTFEVAPVGIVLVGFEKQFLHSNKVFSMMLGYSPEELIGKTIVDVTFTEDRDIGMSDLLRLKNGEINSSRVQKRYVRKDGKIIWGDVTISIVRESNERPQYFFAIIQDITERKQAEEELHKSEENYRSLFNQSTEGIYLHDFEGRVLDVNEMACKQSGYTREEWLGLTVFDGHSSQTKTNVPKAEVLKSWNQWAPEQRFVIEGEHQRKNGTVYPVEISTGVVRYGKRNAILAIVRDITERKQAEEELRKSEASLASAQARAHLGNWELNIAKQTGYWSAEMFCLFGCDPASGQPEFKDFLKIIHPEDRERINVTMSQAIAEHKSYEEEHRIVLPDGNTRWIKGQGEPVFDEQGKMIRFVGAAQDITEQKLMEEQLRQMQKLEGLGTLAGGVAHDFNNILGIILAYITGIMRFKDDTKKLDLATATITKAVERGKTLVQQILTFARKTASEFEPVNVNDVIMEIMTIMFETFPKVITYSQNIDKAIPSISADRSQLYQVILNICINARDAMPKGGVLTINTRLESVVTLRRQHPEAAASSYVCIEVSDTGEGMSEETQKRIFEPFFTTKGIGKGTGLGLSVVFGVVQTHKGFIDVESNIGNLPAGKVGGTTLRVYLPVSQVVEPIIEIEEGTLEEIPGGTETLLVIEDEEMLMMSLQMILIEKGYSVLPAGDGLTALKIYQERKKDIALVLTDLGLPNMTGLEVGQRIKIINPKENIILATGFLDREMKSEFLNVGIHHFIYKPYDLKKVLKMIREVLDEK